jgi:hypothetical protein
MTYLLTFNVRVRKRNLYLESGQNTTKKKSKGKKKPYMHEGLKTILHHTLNNAIIVAFNLISFKKYFIAPFHLNDFLNFYLFI